ncbi:MAG: PH domain-containing protein [Oscillospiraceae bacterium]|nr:PH domain-containing protein [Oscillospiraceae bacterium]
MAATHDKVLWSDRKRYFGLPISFTKYEVSEDRLFMTIGFLNLKYEEILLYRVRDLTLSRSFGQRLFGVGTIKVSSSDKSNSELYIQSVKDPAAVKELIHQQVEDMKIRRRVRFGEIASFGDDIDDVLDNEM